MRWKNSYCYRLLIAPRERKKKTYGLTQKELKSQFRKNRDHKTPGYKRVQELDLKKRAVAVSTLKRAAKNGLRPYIY